MYLFVYLAGIQVCDCYGSILRHTYQMSTLILVDTSGTLIGHEELGDGTTVVWIDQKNGWDTVLVQFVIFTAGVWFFEHWKHEDPAVVRASKVAWVLRRHVDGRGSHLLVWIEESELIVVVDVADQDWLEVQQKRVIMLRLEDNERL